MMIRKMFSRTLRNVAPTWTVQEASNGETALCRVDECEYDIIFMDQYVSCSAVISSVCKYIHISR